MKKAIIFIALAGMFAACNQSSNPTQPVNPNSKNYSPIPNWKKDTFVSTWYDNGDKYDTAYSVTSGGKTCLTYKGVQYELRAFNLIGKAVNDTMGNYFFDMFTMSGTQLSPNVGTPFAIVSKYWDYGFSTWKTQRQSLQVHFSPFPDKAGIYIGGNP